MNEGAESSTNLGEVSLVGILERVGRRWRLMFGLPLGIGAVVVAVSLLSARTYTASAAFTPDAGSGQLGALAGVAAEFGVNLPSGDNAESPQFYADLLLNHQFLLEAVAQPFSWVGALAPVDLATVLDTKSGTPGEAGDATAIALGKLLRVSVNAGTGVVDVEVSLESAQLAKAIVDRLLTQTQEFNVQSRQSRARDERKFIEDRLAEAGARLREEEDRLGGFLQRNRDFRNAPQLQFEYDRLQRAVGLRQDVLTTLARSLEQARIEEVRSTPVLTIVAAPAVNALPDSRRLALKAFLSLIVGLGLGLLIAGGEAYFQAAAKADERGMTALRGSFDEMSQVLRGWLERVHSRLGFVKKP